MKIKLNKIKKLLPKLSRILGEKAFLTFLVLLFLALIFGGLVFYKYSFLIQKIKPEVSQYERPAQLKEDVYREILKNWGSRQKKFEETEIKTYPDPFQGTTSTEGLTI